MNETYKIKKSLRLPIAIALALAIPVFIDVFSRGMASQHIIIISILIISFLIFSINNLIRKISIKPGFITILSISGKKELSIDEITIADGISLGKRQYIVITKGPRNYMIPNTFDKFPEILLNIKMLLPEDKIGKGLIELERFPLNRMGGIAAAWITVAVLISILIIRIYQAF